MYTHRMTLECGKDVVKISPSWADVEGCQCGCKSKLAGMIKITGLSVYCAIAPGPCVLYAIKKKAKECLQTDKIPIFLVKTLHYQFDSNPRPREADAIETQINTHQFRLPTVAQATDITPAQIAILFTTSRPEPSEETTQLKSFELMSPTFQQLLKMCFIH